MFERLFQYPHVLARHREGPVAAARERFLVHCANEGMAPGTLLRIARELLVIATRIDITAETPIARQQIEVAAHRWACHQRQRGRIGEPSGSPQLFSQVALSQVALSWVRFLGRLEAPPSKPAVGTEWMKGFAMYRGEERGLSPRTIHARGWHVEQFLQWLPRCTPSLDLSANTAPSTSRGVVCSASLMWRSGHPIRCDDKAPCTERHISGLAT